MTGWDVTLPHHRAQQTRDEAEVDGGHGVEEGDGAASGSRKQVPSTHGGCTLSALFVKKISTLGQKFVRMTDCDIV